jgi:hypothetical protein
MSGGTHELPFSRHKKFISNIGQIHPDSQQDFKRQMTQQQLLHKRFLNVNMKDVHTYRNVSVSKLKSSNGAFCADVFCQKKKQNATSVLMT